jgi:pilus assembly protein TadC
MKLFLTSLVTGYIGMNIAGALGADDAWVIMLSFAGFMLPYAVVLESISKKLNPQKTDKQDNL